MVEKRGREAAVQNKEEWNQKEAADLLGDEISIDTSQEEFKKMPYSMRGLKYITMNKGILSMPMMVIENDSVLEFRDCMVRSSRSQDGYGGLGDGKSDDRSEWDMKDRSNSFVDEKRERESLSGRRNSLSNGDLEDIAIWINGESLSDTKGVN